MKIGPFSIHRKVQDDLDVKPIVCVHRKTENGSTRVFCAYSKHGQIWISVGGLKLQGEKSLWDRVLAGEKIEAPFIPI